jgi:homoserine dehydrogenase
MKQINVGIFGLGTVGSGVVKIIQKQHAAIAQRTGSELVIRQAVVHNLTKQRDITVDFPVSTNPADILENPDIDVVVEVMGTIDEADQIVRAAFKAGKHVISANKDLIALRGRELTELASAAGVNFYYEAAVAGGIPVLRTLAQSFTADVITRIAGIINGTSNYILSQMRQNGLSYADALSQAQALGFAESDPTNDVGGFDAAYKLQILTGFAFGAQLTLSDMQIAGIDTIDDTDISDTAALGYTIKLLGVAAETDGSLSVQVKPHLVADSHPLASVANENNAVLLNGENVGQIMLYGPGAGELPTANSVMADLTTVARDLAHGIVGEPFNRFSQSVRLATADQRIAKRYIALEVADQPGMMRDVTSIFADQGISFSDIKQTPIGKQQARLMALTYETSDAQLQAAVDALSAIPNIVVKNTMSIFK